MLTAEGTTCTTKDFTLFAFQGFLSDAQLSVPELRICGCDYGTAALRARESSRTF